MLSALGHSAVFGDTFSGMDPAPEPKRILEPLRGAACVSTDRGTLTFWQLGPHAYATEMRGFMTQQMSNLIIERAGPLYSSSRTLHGFHNWFEMTNYDTACRVELTAWVMEHRAQSALRQGR
jgi:hypothetical protein